MNANVQARRVAPHASAGRLGSSVVTQLQPIIDAIAASLRDGRRLESRAISIPLPGAEGRTLIVSVHTSKPCLEPQREFGVRGLDARQLGVINGAIDERIGGPISVSLLSSLTGLSRSRFSQAFRKSVGRSPREHVMRVRIDRAMELMAHSDAALSQIALATGFCDQAHFTNAFRRAIDMTPTQWRKRYRTSCTAGALTTYPSLQAPSTDTDGGRTT